MNCEHCLRDVTEAEPVYRARLWDGHPWFRGYPVIIHLCSDCGTGDVMNWRKWHPPKPCDNCARSVHHSANYKVPLHVTCGPVCREALYAAQARAMRRHHPMRQCQSCGVPFAPKSAAVTRFCSVGCKQMAYRRRLTIRATDAAFRLNPGEGGETVDA